MTVYRRGRTYYYDFYLDRRRYWSRVGPDRREAEQAEAEMRSRALAMRYAKWRPPRNRHELARRLAVLRAEIKRLERSLNGWRRR